VTQRRTRAPPQLGSWLELLPVRPANTRRRAVQSASRGSRARRMQLHFVEPRIHARLVVMIAVHLAAVSQPLDPAGESSVAGHDGPHLRARRDSWSDKKLKAPATPIVPTGRPAAGREVRCAVFDKCGGGAARRRARFWSCLPAGHTMNRRGRGFAVRWPLHSWIEVRRTDDIGKYRRAPVINHGERVNAAESGVVSLRPGPMSSARESARSHLSGADGPRRTTRPCPGRTSDSTMLPTSGPSTNQPAANHRSIAAMNRRRRPLRGERQERNAWPAHTRSVRVSPSTYD